MFLCMNFQCILPVKSFVTHITFEVKLTLTGFAVPIDTSVVSKPLMTARTFKHFRRARFAETAEGRTTNMVKGSLMCGRDSWQSCILDTENRTPWQTNSAYISNRNSVSLHPWKTLQLWSHWYHWNQKIPILHWNDRHSQFHTKNKDCSWWRS